MDVLETAISDVKILVPRRHRDDRGFFCETYNLMRMSRAGFDLAFVQDNHSMSVRRGTVRGLHFQLPPFAQAKLVRVVRGSILDVAVDIRRPAPTFRKHVSSVLSAENGRQMLIPIGFAHGFITLETGTEVEYKVSAPYAPECDRGVRWNDPALGIEWGFDHEAATLSPKDAALPFLADAASLFESA